MSLVLQTTQRKVDLDITDAVRDNGLKPDRNVDLSNDTSIRKSLSRDGWKHYVAVRDFILTDPNFEEFQKEHSESAKFVIGLKNYDNKRYYYPAMIGMMNRDFFGIPYSFDELPSIVKAAPEEEPSDAESSDVPEDEFERAFKTETEEVPTQMAETTEKTEVVDDDDGDIVVNDNSDVGSNEEEEEEDIEAILARAEKAEIRKMRQEQGFADREESDSDDDDGKSVDEDEGRQVTPGLRVPPPNGLPSAQGASQPLKAVAKNAPRLVAGVTKSEAHSMSILSEVRAKNQRKPSSQTDISQASAVPRPHLAQVFMGYQPRTNVSISYVDEHYDSRPSE